MIAAVLHAPGDIRVEEVPEPTVAPGHALVRVSAVGVCGSDLPRMLTKGAHNLPLICGHEFSGVVVETADDVDVPVGTRVTVPPMIPDFDSEAARAGLLGQTPDYDYFGSRRDGAYTELVLVPKTNLLPVPDAVDDIAAASVDPAAIALHALWRTGVTAGERVAVVGAGPIGLFAVQWAKILGASEVVAIDVMDEKLDLARELGATGAMIAGQTADRHRSFDVVVETAGAVPAENDAIRLAGPQGRVVFIGIPPGEVTLDAATFQHLLREEIAVHGAWNSFSAPWPGHEWTASLEMMAQGRLRTAEIVSHRERIEDLPEVLAWMGQRERFFSKVMFFPNGEPDATGVLRAAQGAAPSRNGAVPAAQGAAA
ncbi:galactitol-1-phosphate 5-dehydrogenase [Patulibacter sp. SYSU D01012]|uniref:galactitol-1-phosphate 5-dehydrogenase n=1 Tax=Patulibacter sp. SYSU D01012 TaxID=2817381 RepID=UPI001B306A39|nr:galactitol-1-phosphate 5-dehydrogenase [Patulibacter sp. SYSU D01012]